ncbi:MAG TPA: polyprenyl synthetase family protein [Gemmatimonadaceae bacterium]|nr:polyprenyl synthetase family protein [Gemmatimonadaceae bacterium]
MIGPTTIRSGVRSADAAEVETQLRGIAEWALKGGMAAPELKGNLIRPIVALGGWRSISTGSPTPEFWCGVMAVQLAHEASLLHDDVIDNASHRRGKQTVAASKGIATALVEGDHLLTTAYRYAARTRNHFFVELFAESVERTVAGEIAQARATGRPLALHEYSAIVCGKSGALLGCALSLGAALVIPDRSRILYDIGCRIGVVYQMLDDLLDLSPQTRTGKPPLGDFVHGHWTWPLAHLAVDHSGLDSSSLLRALHHEGLDGRTPARRCLAHYDAEVDAVTGAMRNELGDAPALETLLDHWRARARFAVATEEAAARASRRAHSTRGSGPRQRVDRSEGVRL